MPHSLYLPAHRRGVMWCAASCEGASCPTSECVTSPFSGREVDRMNKLMQDQHNSYTAKFVGSTRRSDDRPLNHEVEAELAG